MPFLWMVATACGLASAVPAIDRAIVDDVMLPADGVVVPRGPDGQFYVNGQIGGRSVRFLVDPDTPDVVVSPADADTLGLRTGPVGPVTVAAAALPAQNVLVRIAAATPVSILGNAYLARLSVVQNQGDRLILR